MPFYTRVCIILTRTLIKMASVTYKNTLDQDKYNLLCKAVDEGALPKKPSIYSVMVYLNEESKKQGKKQIGYSMARLYKSALNKKPVFAEDQNNL